MFDSRTSVWHSENGVTARLCSCSFCFPAILRARGTEKVRAISTELALMVEGFEDERLLTPFFLRSSILDECLDFDEAAYWYAYYLDGGSFPIVEHDEYQEWLWEQEDNKFEREIESCYKERGLPYDRRAVAWKGVSYGDW